MPDPSSRDGAMPSHLRIQTITVPVSDLRRSLVFYEITLEFRSVHRGTFASGAAFALVAPPDGVAILLLSESDSDKRIGTFTGVSFVTTDLAGAASRVVGARRTLQHCEARSIAEGMRMATFSTSTTTPFVWSRPT